MVLHLCKIIVEGKGIRLCQTRLDPTSGTCISKEAEFRLGINEQLKDFWLQSSLENILQDLCPPYG